MTATTVTAPASIGGCVVSVLPRLAHRSGRLEPNAIAERWVRSVRTECLDRVFISISGNLQKVLAEYVGYFNNWRPHRSLDNVRPARRGHVRRIEATKLERLSRYQCLEASITSISGPHDLPDRFFLRPTGLAGRRGGPPVGWSCKSETALPDNSGRALSSPSVFR
jgi:Integrase core domain